MSNPYSTFAPTYEKLFEEGDYYITPIDPDYVSLERNSVIIHLCPYPQTQTGVWGDDNPFQITIIMPYGKCEPCYYCKQVPPNNLITVYKLHNWDKFASDRHVGDKPPPRHYTTPKFPRRNG